MLALDEAFFLAPVVDIAATIALKNHAHPEISQSLKGKIAMCAPFAASTPPSHKPALGNDDDKGSKYGLFGPWIRVSEGQGRSSLPTGLIFFDLSVMLAADGTSAVEGPASLKV